MPHNQPYKSNLQQLTLGVYTLGEYLLVNKSITAVQALDSFYHIIVLNHFWNMNYNFTSSMDNFFRKSEKTKRCLLTFSHVQILNTYRILKSRAYPPPLGGRDHANNHELMPRAGCPHADISVYGSEFPAKTVFH